MAVVIRYFSTVGNGAADGTSWADRAALFASGNWSTVITGFNFSGSDSLVGRIEGALNYTCSQTLANGLFTNPPTVNNNLTLHGCDSSGNLVAIPDPTWVSSAPPFSHATLPTIETTTNIATVLQAHTLFRLIRVTASGRPGLMLTASQIDWCYIEQNTSNVASLVTSSPTTNTVAILGGTTFDGFISSGLLPILNNVRIDGKAGTAGGNRYGINATTSGNVLNRVTVIGCVGGGVVCAGGSATRFSDLYRCLIVDCGTYGIKANATASQTVYHTFVNNVIVNCVNGIDGSSNGRLLLSNNRLRNNTTADHTNVANANTSFDTVTTGTNADEFVDAAAGDYRIKLGSSIWGKGFGPGDQPASGGGGGGNLINSQALVRGIVI